MPDPTELALQAALAEDDQFKALIKQLAIEGARRQYFILKHGTPADQLRVIGGLQRTFEKVLAAGEQDNAGQDLLDQAQGMLKNILSVDGLPMDEDDSDDDGPNSASD